MLTITPKQDFIARWLASRPEVRRVTRFGVRYKLTLWPDGRRKTHVVHADDMPEVEFPRLWEAAYDDFVDDI